MATNERWEKVRNFIKKVSYIFIEEWLIFAEIVKRDKRFSNW